MLLGKFRNDVLYCLFDGALRGGPYGFIENRRRLLVQGSPHFILHDLIDRTDLFPNDVGYLLSENGFSLLPHADVEFRFDQ